MRFAAIILGCAAMLATPVQAQDADDLRERWERNKDLQTGSRLKRSSESPDKGKLRDMQKRVARCVVFNDKDLSRRMVAASDTSNIDYDSLGMSPNELFDNLDVQNCMGRASRGRSSAMFMSIPMRTLRNLMVEEVYLMDQSEPILVSESDPRILTNRFYAQGNSRGAEMTAELSDCIVYFSPSEAHEFLNTRPGSGKESKALDGLYAALITCAGDGMAEADIDMSSMRMVIADGLYARMQYDQSADAAATDEGGE